jgi:uncharacterized membrane protein YbhN (UPF0104 family)
LATPTSTPTQTPDGAPGEDAAAEPAPRGGRFSRLSLLGGLGSGVCVGGVVWWALRQKAPDLPNRASEWWALAGAVALYGVATLVRGERWLRLLHADGATASRADAQALNVVGYMGNNILPARAGDAIRVVLMAPRADVSRRTVVGTLVAERLLDIAVILTLFLVVGYGLLGAAGAGVGWVILAIAVILAGAAGGVLLIRRNERLHALAAPMLASTLRLRGRHGLVLLAMTFLIWSIEAATWMSVGAAAGLNMNPIEGCYLVALASVFALIPSGPGYAGTQDAAAIFGVKAIGGTKPQAVGYLLLLRFTIVVPITLCGLVLMATRYGGFRRLRALRRAPA